jgi:hypothetical protein
VGNSKERQSDKHLILSGGKHFLPPSRSLPLHLLTLHRVTPSEDHSAVSANDSALISLSQDKCESLKEELQHVLDETHTKVEKLKATSDIHIGEILSPPSHSLTGHCAAMEILHLFILDLLGRDTPAAKIFRMKSEEDFRHSMVVTKLFKALTWICIVLLNLGLVFFTMLRALQRGFDWQVSQSVISLSVCLIPPQRVYLFACILQFVVEILFYETTECLLMSFFIPDLVRTEVQSVGFSLRQTVQKVCAGNYNFGKDSHALDAPSYLFISTYASLPCALCHSPSLLSLSVSLSVSMSLTLSLVEMLRIISLSLWPVPSFSLTKLRSLERFLINGNPNKKVLEQNYFTGFLPRQPTLVSE